MASSRWRVGELAVGDTGCWALRLWCQFVGEQAVGDVEGMVEHGARQGMCGREDGWLVGSVDGWLDRWMDGWMDVWRIGRLGGGMDGGRIEWLLGWRDGWMNGWVGWEEMR